MAEKAMQVVLLRHRVPFPVGGFEVAEQNRGVGITPRVITPHIDIALRAVLGRPSSSLEPRMEITGVIQHQIENHLHALTMGGGQKPMEGGEISQIGMDVVEGGDVVAPIPQW